MPFQSFGGYVLSSRKRVKILVSSKLTEYAVDNFRLDKNGGKFSERVQNTVGKGEIARYEQFLLFPTVFSKEMCYRQVKI